MGQGSAPAAASPERFRQEGLDRVPGAGALAAAVPAAVDAWLLLLRDHGTWELGDVGLRHRVRARRAPRARSVRRTIAGVGDLFREHWSASAAFWMPDGEAPVAGSLVRNPTWAAAMERILAEASTAAGAGTTREQRIEAARTVWAEGFVAEEMVASVQDPHRHSTGADHAGLITAADLAGSRASWEDAVSIGFRGLRIWKTDAWGQGPALLQALMILDGFTDEEIDPATAAGIHRIIEAQKLALADREAYYGDAVPGGAPSTCCCRPSTRPRGARSSPTMPRTSCVPDASTASSPSCRRSSSRVTRPPPPAARASRRSPARARPAATPATSTSSTGAAT